MIYLTKEKKKKKGKKRKEKNPDYICNQGCFFKSFFALIYLQVFSCFFPFF